MTYTDPIDALNVSRGTPWPLTDWLRERVLEEEGEGGGTEAELLRLCLLLKVEVVVGASVTDFSLTWRIVGRLLLELQLLEAATTAPRAVSARSVIVDVVDVVVDVVVDAVVDAVVDSVAIGAVVMMVVPKIAD